MPRTPATLARFNKNVLPTLIHASNGPRILRDVKAIQETDQWNSFDKFHDTTKTLVESYNASGAKSEVHEIQTGGRFGSGRWIIQEAEDFVSATADIIHPVKQRIIDYSKNPWGVIQWTAATPREGITGDLVIIDTKEQLEKTRSLTGKIILTCLDPRALMPMMANKGAVGVISDKPIPINPSATGWVKFGWGGVPISDGPVRMVGLVLSAKEGKSVRRLYERSGGLRLRLKVNVRRYSGTHDVVSGIVEGALNPQDEVWAIAHSAEPGALDNASGGAVCLEIARIIEALIQQGKLPRPKRTIRLVHGYECYGFFGFLEDVRRFETPLAGVCIDTVGSKPEVCDGILGWHATIPNSAGFVDRVGEAILKSTLKRTTPGYRYKAKEFVSTSDTLIGDPKYGFPCPWLTTHYKKDGNWTAYHSSADQTRLMSTNGLLTCATSMAAYLYFLADAGTRELTEIAAHETERTVELMKGRSSDANKRYHASAHATSMDRLKRWIWEGERAEVIGTLDSCTARVKNAAGVGRLRAPKTGRRIPRRKAVLSPTMENTPKPIADRFKEAGLWDWVLFWADGHRNLAEIAEAASCERNKEITVDKVNTFFEAQAELGYVDLIAPEAMSTRQSLIRDLKKLGLSPGMDVIVHSSLSAIGHVIGGADTVVDALLSVIGRKGTLMMPSFNHRGAHVYHPAVTRTTNGAIPDALWRRKNAVRSIQPTHPVAAIGPRAKEFCEGHLEAGIWGADSPIGKLIQSDGYILALGVTHHSSTAYHVAEISMGAGCIDQFASDDRIIDENGALKVVPGLAYRSGLCPVSPKKLDQALTRRKQNRTGKVANADASLVKAIDLWKMRRQHLKGMCPECKVKPNVVRLK